MGINTKIHNVTVSIVKTTYKEIENGTEIKLLIRAACNEFCDFRGTKVKLIDKNSEIQEIELTKFNGAENETDEILVKTSVETGEYTWTAVFPEQEKKGALHEESSASFTFSFNPHSISMVVWDIPDTVQLKRSFKVKAGIKCSAECNMAENRVEVYDQEGYILAAEKLSDTPWQGTSALYWSELELNAPDTEGYFTWLVRFPTQDAEIPHYEASASFSFIVVKRPECRVTVEVIDKEEKISLKNADVILHPYRVKTDENGIAILDVPKGSYQLYVLGENQYEKYSESIVVIDNLSVKAELILAPVKIGDA